MKSKGGLFDFHPWGTTVCSRGGPPSLSLHVTIAIQTRTICETCSQRERMEILVCDWHGWDDFARLDCCTPQTTDHKPHRTDTETRIDQVPSGLLGAQPLHSSLSSCPTDRPTVQIDGPVHINDACTLPAYSLYIVFANSVSASPDRDPPPKNRRVQRDPGRPRMFHIPDRQQIPTCQAHGGPSQGLLRISSPGPLISSPARLQWGDNRGGFE